MEDVFKQDIRGILSRLVGNRQAPVTDQDGTQSTTRDKSQVKIQNHDHSRAPPNVSKAVHDFVQTVEKARKNNTGSLWTAWEILWEMVGDLNHGAEAPTEGSDEHPVGEYPASAQKPFVDFLQQLLSHPDVVSATPLEGSSEGQPEEIAEEKSSESSTVPSAAPPAVPPAVASPPSTATSTTTPETPLQIVPVEWSKLPEFGWVVRDGWNFDYGSLVGEHDVEEIRHIHNQTAFLAQLTTSARTPRDLTYRSIGSTSDTLGDSVDVTNPSSQIPDSALDYLLYALWAFRDALEEDEKLISHCCIWCHKTTIQHVREEDGNTGNNDQKDRKDAPESPLPNVLRNLVYRSADPSNDERPKSSRKPGTTGTKDPKPGPNTGGDQPGSKKTSWAKRARKAFLRESSFRPTEAQLQCLVDAHLWLHYAGPVIRAASRDSQPMPLRTGIVGGGLFDHYQRHHLDKTHQWEKSKGLRIFKSEASTRCSFGDLPVERGDDDVRSWRGFSPRRLEYWEFALQRLSESL